MFVFGHFFLLELIGESTEVEISEAATTLLPGVTAQMEMTEHGTNTWANGVIGPRGKTFIWGAGTANPETYRLYEAGETTVIRYVNLEKYTRPSELDTLVGIVNSLADQRKPSGKKYTSKPLVSEGGDNIQDEHGAPGEVHRNSLMCLRNTHGLVASNSSDVAEQLSALAMIGLSTGVYAGSKIETDGERNTITATYDTPFIFATDGHVAGAPSTEGTF